MTYELDYADSVDYESDFYTCGGFGGGVASLITLPGTGGLSTAYAASAGGVSAIDAIDYANVADCGGAVFSGLGAAPGLATGLGAWGRPTAEMAANGGTMVRSGTWWSRFGRWGDSRGAAYSGPLIAGWTIHDAAC